MNNNTTLSSGTSEPAAIHLWPTLKWIFVPNGQYQTNNVVGTWRRRKNVWGRWRIKDDAHFLAMRVFTVYRLPVPCTDSFAGGLHSINRRMLLRLHTFVQCQCTRTKVHCNKWANTCVVRVRVVYAVKSVHRCESDGRKDKCFSFCFSFVSYQLQWPIHKAKQTMATTTWRYKLELPVISHTQFGCHNSYGVVQFNAA